MKNNIKLEKASKYKKDFSDKSFWDKVTKYAKKAGGSVLEPALKMYYSAQDEDTPLWAKTTIFGALGYFISPIDAIPDITPVVGYSDDLGVLTAAIAVVATHIKDEHVKKAKETLKKWFNNYETNSVKIDNIQSPNYNFENIEKKETIKTEYKNSIIWVMVGILIGIIGASLFIHS